MNILTWLVLLLVAVVAVLAWVLLTQRRRVAIADGPMIDQDDGPIELARIAVEQLTNLSTAKGEDPMEARTTKAEQAPAEARPDALFPTSEAQDLRRRWDAIQASFVDEPRRAVEEADRLVASAVKRLSDTFAVERQSLEAQRAGGSEVSTEDLRLALRRYKSYFSRLLAI